MRSHTSSQPHRHAALRLHELLRDREAICIISGGSALDVFAELPEDDLVRTIFMLGDERWSRAPGSNNYVQYAARFTDHPLLPQLVDTSVAPDESHRAYAERLARTFKQLQHERPHALIIALLGIGSDGHTAGIFPMNEQSFIETYEADVPYVPINVEGLSEPFRASLTPSEIERSAAIVAYATGSEKHDVLTELHVTKRSLHEQPAQLIARHANADLFTDQSFS